jgi:hypothetical protein
VTLVSPLPKCFAPGSQIQLELGLLQKRWQELALLLAQQTEPRWPQQLVRQMGLGCSLLAQVMALVLVARSQPVPVPWLPKELVPESWLQLALVSPQELELLVLGPMGLVLKVPEPKVQVCLLKSEPMLRSR